MNGASKPALGLTLVAVGITGLVATTLLSSAVLPSTTCIGGACARVPRADGASAVDAMFIEKMVAHHSDAIAMAELALERSKRPEIVGLAGSIIETQQAENGLMREWYRDWFGTVVPESSGSGMMGGMMGGAADLRVLEQTEDFDREFIETMIPHHRMGVMMATMARGATGRPEVVELTGSIIETQSEEIEQMLTWYLDWYDR